MLVAPPQPLQVLGPDFGLTVTCHWGRSGDMKVDAFPMGQPQAPSAAGGSKAAAGSNGAPAQVGSVCVCVPGMLGPPGVPPHRHASGDLLVPVAWLAHAGSYIATPHDRCSA